MDTKIKVNFKEKIISGILLNEDKETIIGELDLDEFGIQSINAIYSGLPIGFPTGMTIIVKDIEALYVEEL